MAHRHYWILEKALELTSHMVAKSALVKTQLNDSIKCHITINSLPRTPETVKKPPQLSPLLPSHLIHPSLLFPPLPPLLPNAPPTLSQVLLNNQISPSAHPPHPAIQSHIHPSLPPGPLRSSEPSCRTDNPRYTSNRDLRRGMIVQVNAAERDGCGES